MKFSIFNNLPDFKGKRRIARILFGRTIKKVFNIYIKGRFGVNYKLPNIIENVGFEIFINGVYEQNTIQFILSKLPNEATFIDVGANIGAIFIPVSRLKKGIRIVAVEASSAVFGYLNENVEINNCKNIKIINTAISNKDNQILIFFSPKDFYGKGSFSPIYTDVPESVITITLDTLLSNEGIEKVDFIKVDVEGYEYSIFAGAKKILSSENAPDILFEYLDWAELEATNEKGSAQKILKSYGYTLFRLKENGILQRLDEKLTFNSAMIFATKKNI